MKRAPVDPRLTDRLNAALAELRPLGMSGRDLAAMLGWRSSGSIAMRTAGRVAVEPAAVEWLEALVAYLRANPPPTCAQTRHRRRAECKTAR